MPGEKQYITGPSGISGAMALQTPTSDEPKTTAGFDAIALLASCTPVCGLLPSS